MSDSRLPIKILASDERGGPTAPAGSLDLFTLIRLGMIPGAKIETITGRREGVTAESEIRSGTAATVSRPSSAGVVALVSSSASDTAAGTGARSVVVEYIDADGYSRVGLAVTNGVGSVQVLAARTVGRGNDADVVALDPAVQATALAINRAYAYSVGSGQWNAGTIDVSIAGAVQCSIGPAAGVSWSSAFRVPITHRGLVRDLGLKARQVGVPNLPAVVRIYAQNRGKSRAMWTAVEVSTDSAPSISSYLTIEPRSLFLVTADSSAGGGSVNVSLVLQLALLPLPGVTDPNPDRQPPILG